MPYRHVCMTPGEAAAVGSDTEEYHGSFASLRRGH
jgi:hypothetical protein